ncbi:tetratricopeptide repeat protein, partial [bacterium]|nr:tetratricopeptide repeat protein [bacterium]
GTAGAEQRTFRALLATEGQTPALKAASDVDLALVACQALGRIALAGDAVTALGRYLAAEEDEGRAADAAEALLRIARERKDTRATALVEAARDRRFGWNSLFWTRTRRFYADAPSAPALAPRTAADWNERGLVRRGKGDVEGAISDYGKAIELDPLSDLTRALELDPRYTRALINRGNARQKKGDFEGAVADYGKALELDPRHADAWKDRALARLSSGDRDGAAKDLERFLDLAPGDPEAPAARAKLAELRAR